MYVIYYRGIFSEGYVKHTFGEERVVPHKTDQEGIDFASKYRFKFIADLFCRFHNWEAQRNYDFRNFKVKKI